MTTSTMKIHSKSLDQDQLDFFIAYEKPQMQELSVPTNVVSGKSGFDLGDKRNFDGQEENTNE